MIVISVSKRWYHPRSEVREHGKNGAKKRWFVFYLNDEGKLRTKRINWSQVWYYKLQKRRKRTLICDTCDREFIGYIKSDTEEVACPYCND